MGNWPVAWIVRRWYGTRACTRAPHRAAATRPVHPTPGIGGLLLVGAIRPERVEHQPLEAVTLVVLIGSALRITSSTCSTGVTARHHR